jgi:hypothetical protein
LRQAVSGLEPVRLLALEVARNLLSVRGASTGAPAGARGSTVHQVKLSNTLIELRETEYEGHAPTYVNLHEDEQTSVGAGHAAAARFGGRVIEMRSRGRRNLCFWLGLRAYCVDPNRIFTDVGTQTTLRRYAGDSARARNTVKDLREQVLKMLQKNGRTPIVALHNNDGSRYSIASYRAGGLYATDAAQVAQRVENDPGDFFLVNRSAVFDALREAGFNVVLQSAVPSDDGSLSVWCQKEGIDYVNVEAVHGHREQQQKMLFALARILDSTHL